MSAHSNGRSEGRAGHNRVIGFLPIFGFWMLPLGILLIAQDVPFIRPPLARLIAWIEAKWQSRRRPPDTPHPRFALIRLSLRVRTSVFPRLDYIRVDLCLAQRPAGFEPMQALHKHETIAVPAYENWRLLAHLQNALGELLHHLGLQQGAPLRRHVNVGDGKCFPFEHDPDPALPTETEG
jgi:hypothetical protein